jgi:hypothetical protein
MNAHPGLLDHVVLATPDLEAPVADFARRTGVRPVPGGAHPGRGTRNYLVSLGGSGYLEIIGPDTDQPEPPLPRPFGIDRLTGPRTVTWAISPPDLDRTVARAHAVGYDPGPVLPMSRRRPDGTLLSWRLTSFDTAHPSGLVPFLIDWTGSAHPTQATLPQTPLLDLSARTPDPDGVRALILSLGTSLPMNSGPLRLSLTVDTARGPVTFT